MKIIISGVHLKKSPDIEEYARKKIEKLSKFHANIISAKVRLISEKSHRGQEQDFYCEIELEIPKRHLSIIDTERSMDKAIDRATDRMKTLLRRTKEKAISKRHKEGVKAKTKIRT